MTNSIQSTAPGGSSIVQSSLPFSDSELLAVRLLPSEFARAVGVSKQCVSLWVKNEKVTLGADGRLNPQAAMRQLLRNGNPGRIRARIVRQAFADMADLRTEAARASDLEQQLAAAKAQRLADQTESDRDYETMDHWLNEFARQIGECDLLFRGQLDADGWRAYVQETLVRAMDDDADLSAIDDIVADEITDFDLDEFNKQIADLEIDNICGSS